ncbi:hypothetical protein MMC21_001840 [Puttea exsequens]|nr:hypothetical protein [Puttea exsequens]
MPLLDSHLEQISLSSAAIAELPFPPPKVFTNALLHSHDITALIRDTEAHERALFTLTTAEQGQQPSQASIARRSTVHNPHSAGEPYINGGSLLRNQKTGSTVATLLGGDLGEQVRKESTREGKDRGEVDVNLLLNGAEKLCGIYPITGAPERIASMRSRSEQLNSSIARYEGRIANQMAQLAKMNTHKDGSVDFEDEDDEDLDNRNVNETDSSHEMHVTEEDLRKEDEEIRELEKKKRVLEDRVSGMERDLGGLLR